MDTKDNLERMKSEQLYTCVQTDLLIVDNWLSLSWDLRRNALADEWFSGESVRYSALKKSAALEGGSAMDATARGGF